MEVGSACLYGAGIGESDHSLKRVCVEDERLIVFTKVLARLTDFLTK